MIKLYEDKKKEPFTSHINKNDENGFITPRKNSSSHRKGITVYSSVSTRKHSTTAEVISKTDHVVSIHNASTNNNE